MLLGLKVAEEIGPEVLPATYRSRQKEIVEEFNVQEQLKASPSHSILLAHIPPEQVIYQNPQSL